MTTTLLKIHFKQLSRLLGEAGIFRAIFLLGLLCFGLLAMFIKLDDPAYHEIIFGVFALSLLSIHLKRKDKTFLSIYAPKPQLIFFVEYFLLALPLLISLVYYNLWNYTLAFLLFLLILPFIKISAGISSINSVFQKMIPNGNFEWKAGLRKYLFAFVGIWLAGLASSFFVAGVPLAIFAMGVLVLSFYENNESLQILIANEFSVGKFLAWKIKNHLLVFSIFAVPLLLSYAAFNPQYYYIPLIEFLVFAILLVYTILLKYAFYSPNDKSGVTQVFTMIGIVCIFVPVFIPVILVLSIRFLIKAKSNLNFYLNDFN